ncbi:NADH ubiquinone oxidoreductase, 20 Kd subunit [Leptospira inadai serovar Lyme str. 10]|uniref:NADH ubiquinone oxidoreductase, 20 Kd subunit n=2 Tax=Leptospira inadai serovar Lyme TaxID=293084 RepID=V6HEX0_9LEPT|nr:4Fe-4S dicluster domain-containing protein [Leptospira inadai]EQA37983.1 NADH ubiquinone oxidoreductase, 20 Kd subunit [Leptospira inadai serovar Lyme str. 10]PNV76355.1 4Fe-4S dicluster domain-containing protein [Leptospira inadai serovar Lyme]
MKLLYEVLNIFKPAKNMDFKKVLPTNPNARGIPVPNFKKGTSCLDCKACEKVCPTKAMQIKSAKEIVFDYGACLQCGLCAEACPDDKIEDSGFVHVYSVDRNALVVSYIDGIPAEYSETLSENVKEFRKITKNTGFQYREVAASGNNSTEAEINASFNAVFDSEASMVRVVASPKHADALVYAGPVGVNMETPLLIAWDTMPETKALIACGTEAVSGGLFTRGKLPKEPDLFIAGDPPRPDVMISAFRYLMGTKKYSFRDELSKFIEAKKNV